MSNIIESFIKLNPILQAFICTLFTFVVTCAGASLVLFMKKVNHKILDFMMGISSGIMIAAAFWSLILPAINLCNKLGKEGYIIPAIGIMSGGLFIVLSDVILDKLLKLEASNKKSILLASAVTLHNIPEGMAIGVAFGSLALGIDDVSIVSAVLLAFGIGIQNFPEGACVAMPLKNNGHTKYKAFAIGSLSAIVEPISGVLGALFALEVQNALPFLLTFSAGAMIAVVCSELIPDAFKNHKSIATIGVVIGFIIMMVLDVALG